MESITTRDNIEQLAEKIFMYRINREPLIGIDNFVRLRKWAISRGLHDSQIFEGVPKEVREACIKKDVPLRKRVMQVVTSPVRTLTEIVEDQNEYTTNEVSVRIFDNIQQHFKTGPEIFFEAGKEVAEKNKLFRFVIPFTGTSVDELAHMLASFNARYNKTKSIEITKLLSDENTERMRADITHLPGLMKRSSIANWNFGWYDAILKRTRDKNLKVTYPLNDESGNWPVEAEFTPRHKMLRDYLLSPMTRILSAVIKKQLELRKEAIEADSRRIIQLAKTELREAKTLLMSLESRHPNSAYHSLHQIPLVALTAKQLGFSLSDIEIMVKGTMLHDIGKNPVPDSILNKPGRFDDDELIIMQTHAALGQYYLLKTDHDLRIARIAGLHHASPNGLGYPEIGPNGIDLAEAVVQFWDSFVGLTERRIYRTPHAFSLEKAVEILNADIYKGRVHPVIGRMILDQTLPMLIAKGYSPHSFDLSLSEPNGNNYERLLKDIQNYIFGQSNEFELRNRPFFEAYSPRSETAKEAIEEIGIHLRNMYDNLKKYEFKQMFKRIVPAELRVRYLPNDGVPSV